MKQIVFLALLSCCFLNAPAQTDTATLNSCLTYAEKYFPALQQKGILRAIASLNNSNTVRNYLPQINLEGMSSWQSAAIDMGNVFSQVPQVGGAVDFPEPLYFQYRLTLQLSQIIYDGGRTRHTGVLNTENMAADTLAVQVKFQEVKESVNRAYFTVLILLKKKEILQLMGKELENRYISVTAAVKNGILLHSDKLSIEAEMYQTQQFVIEVNQEIHSAIGLINILCHTDYDTLTAFKMPHIPNWSADMVKRVEHSLFSKRMDNVLLRENLLKANRTPFLSCFFQAGYGLPGMNPLSDDPNEIIYVGAKLSWNIWDWNITQRKIQTLQLQKEYIDKDRQVFDDKIKLGLKKESDKIKAFEDQIEKDKKIIEVRSLIADMSKEQLDNGVITATEYLTELLKKSKAQLQLESHLIMLVQARANRNIILGH